MGLGDLYHPKSVWPVKIRTRPSTSVFLSYHVIGTPVAENNLGKRTLYVLFNNYIELTSPNHYPFIGIAGEKGRGGTNRQEMNFYM